MNKKIYAYGIAFTLFLHCSSLVAGVQLRLSHPNVRIGNGMVAYKGKQIVVNGRPLGSCLSSKDFGLDDLVIEGRKDGHAYVNGQKVAEDGTVTVPTDAASQAAYKKSLPTMKMPEMPEMPHFPKSPTQPIPLQDKAAGVLVVALFSGLSTLVGAHFYNLLTKGEPTSYENAEKRSLEELITAAKGAAVGGTIGSLFVAVQSLIEILQNRDSTQKD